MKGGGAPCCVRPPPLAAAGTRNYPRGLLRGCGTRFAHPYHAAQLACERDCVSRPHPRIAAPRTPAPRRCEPNYAWSPYIAEFWNTVSSVPIVLSGLIGVYNALRFRYGLRFLLPSVIMTFVSSGSGTGGGCGGTDSC